MPPVQIACQIQPDRAVDVGEILTFTAMQNPANVAVAFVFDHGDGTLDPGSVSNAFYEAPGTYAVKLNWSYGGVNGSMPCGTVTVLAPSGTPTPTPTPTMIPAVSISCQIQPQRAVTVGEILTYTAVQDPTTVPVQYVFDHGDGTRDPGAVSRAFYRTAGSFNVTLDWAHSGVTGTIECGVVTVTDP